MWLCSLVVLVNYLFIYLLNNNELISELQSRSLYVEILSHHDYALGQDPQPSAQLYLP